MDVTNQFEIDAAPEAAWDLLLNVPRVLPCMPGAELIETVSDNEWRARLSTRLGAMKLGFDADVTREAIDQDRRTVALKAVARERSGRGGAEARIVNQLEASGGRTVVHVATALSLTGAVARFGRHALIRDLAAQMTEQFAANLERELTIGAGGLGDAAAGGPPPTSATTGAAPAPSAMRMIAGILIRGVIRQLESLLHWIEHGERTR
jgi:carbon monoxide dehydrogenase subunit G